MNKQYWLDLAEIRTKLRVMPSLLLLVYGGYSIRLAEWYIHLPSVDRTLEASGFVALVLAAFAKLCDWYMTTGGQK